jgi:hypothetical protein
MTIKKPDGTQDKPHFIELYDFSTHHYMCPHDNIELPDGAESGEITFRISCISQAWPQGDNRLFACHVKGETDVMLGKKSAFISSKSYDDVVSMIGTIRCDLGEAAR